MKLHLIAPRWPAGSLWGQIWFRFPYLALTTLAALTDDTWQVKLIDENLERIDFEDLPDLVGITLMTPLAPRGYLIADRYRRLNVPVILGGIHTTMMPAEAGRHGDAVVLGEAEHTWPRVLADFKKGALQPVYTAREYCDLAKLALARRSLLDQSKYFFTHTLQTTRGCPFDCEFCSVTSFYGRTYRTRPVARVVEEIEQMRARILFFVDDNIVGNPNYARRLFKALEPLKLRWFSQASINISKDRDLLQLAARSGCRGLFIGFESLSQTALKAMGKSPNQARHYRRAVRIIHDHGIGIQGSFIFGTDYDDQTVFGDVLRFTEQNHIDAALFSVLTPFPGTRLRQSMLAAGRILTSDWEKYDMNQVVFKPRKMSPRQLQSGFAWAYKRLYGICSMSKRLWPLNKNSLFYGIQNFGFRQAWKKTLKGTSWTE